MSDLAVQELIPQLRVEALAVAVLPWTSWFDIGRLFYSMKEIRVLAERWRVHYNTVRPHSSLGYRPPAPEAWVPNSLGYGEVETATRFPLLHTPDCDEITNQLVALH